VERIWYRYGITQEEYDSLFEQQGGLCAVCRCPPEVRNGIERRLAVDHSHKSGRNRALLCSRCNLVLGHCQDQPELLRRLMEYLLSHGERLDSFIEDNPETAAAREAEWLRSRGVPQAAVTLVLWQKKDSGEEKKELEGKTDENGFVAFPDVNAQKFAITVTMKGYRSYWRWIRGPDRLKQLSLIKLEPWISAHK
jgi:hypothetical protein